MYGPPPVAPVSAGRRGGLASAPVLAISCLLFIVFLIAATIVLALIPIYLPRKGAAGTTAKPRRFFVVLTFNGTIGRDGALDAQARASVARALEIQYGLPPGSINVRTLILATTRPGKRRRRERGLRRVRRGSDGMGGDQRIVGECETTGAFAVQITARSFTDTLPVGYNDEHRPVIVSITVEITAPGADNNVGSSGGGSAGGSGGGSGGSDNPTTTTTTAPADQTTTTTTAPADQTTTTTTAPADQTTTTTGSGSQTTTTTGSGSQTTTTTGSGSQTTTTTGSGSQTTTTTSGTTSSTTTTTTSAAVTVNLG